MDDFYKNEYNKAHEKLCIYGGFVGGLEAILLTGEISDKQRIDLAIEHLQNFKAEIKKLNRV